MREFIDRLLQGYDGRLLVEDMALRQQLLTPLTLATMTLQDGAELASFLIRTTVDAQRFVGHLGFLGSGGLVDVATITAKDGLQYIAYDEMCANAEVSKAETVKGRLCDWATQYYVAGRTAARERLSPIHGNLLHHAVEMFLKVALVKVVGLQELKDKFGHNLEKLWQRFKAEEVDSALDRFDATVHALHGFEELRYPDKIPHGAILLAITWQPEDAATSHGTIKAKQYEVIISDVDRLVIEVLKRIPLNPKFYIKMVGRNGREALRYQNPHATDWLTPENEHT